MDEQIPDISQAGPDDDAPEIFRVYRREWVIVFVSTVPPGDGPYETCQRQFDTVYAGRVNPEDVRYEIVGSGEHLRTQLQLWLPVLKAEFKYAFLAQRHAEAEGWPDYDIVARNSPADHDLRGYSIKKLPA